MTGSKIQPFLMFEGDAEAAINLYVSLFAGSQVLEIVRYGENEAGVQGSVKRARFSIGNQTILCCDSAVQHAFTFTPSFSLFVECHSEEEIHRLFAELSTAGDVFMPLSSYGFSRKFAWLNDRFGVAWQLNFA
jgi:predicted 3-demethylubiquinone-9 3-methyltransferase (glyoxalase superfamily)